MNGEPLRDDLPDYVATASTLARLPLAPERAAAVVTVMRRIALFAENLTAFELSHDVEIAGVFIP